MTSSCAWEAKTDTHVLIFTTFFPVIFFSEEWREGEKEGWHLPCLTGVRVVNQKCNGINGGVRLFAKDCDVNKNLTKGHGMNDNGKIQCDSAKSTQHQNFKVHNVYVDRSGVLITATSVPALNKVIFLYTLNISTRT